MLAFWSGTPYVVEIFHNVTSKFGPGVPDTPTSRLQKCGPTWARILERCQHATVIA